MISLDSSPVARQGIEREIDGALSRLQRRATNLGDGARYLASAIRRATEGGKRFRPLLVASAFQTLGGDDDHRIGVYQVAAAFELLHTAFVIHDDVIDHDTERRGLPNVAGEFRDRGAQKGADAEGSALLGDAAAILAGDLLLHEAGRMIALAQLPDHMRHPLLEMLDDAVLISAMGELSDVEHSVSAGEVDAEAILRTTRDKTAAYSFSAPLQAGALMAGAPTPSIYALERFGQKLGLAYQLVDDLIGAFGSSALSGKEEGCDLREAKKTHLISLARQSPYWPEVSEALAQAHTGPIAVRAAQDALALSGARADLECLIFDTLEDTLGIIEASTLPEACRGVLRGLVRAVQERIP
ncbi:geranylgeranyl diphosphate synthase type II [Microbacterium sp. 1154]|uniref:polyprenyl synthetase family protein n=1 Tax=Microbacterium sp. 1154 TaxID=2817733 RepID=UPI002858A81F|nr:polyprenyl synthetase family protein [Microbacterium sp. 1154]MDR6691225.1 geranylgeranyl diphosphate synthase type II [Microbacterium sp. 1154]